MITVPSVWPRPISVMNDTPHPTPTSPPLSSSYPSSPHLPCLPIPLKTASRLLSEMNNVKENHRC